MTNLGNIEMLWRIVTDQEKRLKVLEEMQGPELGLVGDVAERIPEQGTAEVAKPGERGVGEIGGADELRQIVYDMLIEARRGREVARTKKDVTTRTHFEGAVDALSTLLDRVDRRTGERSDLSNAEPIRAGVGSEST